MPPPRSALMRLQEMLLALPLMCCLCSSSMFLLLATRNLGVAASNCHVRRSDAEPSEAIIQRPLGCIKISGGGAKLGDAGVESLIRQLGASKNTKLHELNLPDNKLTAVGVKALASWLSGPEAPPGLVKLNL